MRRLQGKLRHCRFDLVQNALRAVPDGICRERAAHRRTAVQPQERGRQFAESALGQNGTQPFFLEVTRIFQLIAARTALERHEQSGLFQGDQFEEGIAPRARYGQRLRVR